MNLVIGAARLAFSGLFSRESRSVVWKSLGMTIVLFFGVWFGLETLSSTFLTPLLGPWPWLTTAIAWLLGAGVVIGAGFLLAPATAIFAGLFLDEVAEHVELNHYPTDPGGRAVPLGPSIWLAAKFTVVVIVANLIALLLVLLPGINFAIFFLVNGYLLGREYFQFAAMRFRSESDSNRVRKGNRGSVFLGGLVIAGFMAVPVLNLFTPVFAASLMVHLHKGITHQGELAPVSQPG